MWSLLFLTFIITSCYAETEFSSRPTNVSLLLLHFTRQEVNGPIFIGTFGLWGLMSSLSYGSVQSTSREIFRGLLLFTNRTRFNTQYKNLTDTLFEGNTDEVTISNKNFVFADKDFLVLPDFRNMLLEYYNAIFNVIDFQDPISADSANRYVRLSSPPVQKIFTSDDFKDASLVMSNVLFFKGQWKLPFNVSNTRRESVRSFDGKTGTVDVMYGRGKVPFSHIESMKASAMELSYGSDGKYCMLLLLPDPNISVNEVYTNFEKLTFRDIFAKIQSDVRESGLKEIEVKLPRFSKRSKLQLQKPLNDIGIYDAFEPQYAAFAEMVREPIYIESIEHNAVISVTESGTVAYATTPGIHVDIPNIDENKVMEPLIYFIMEKTTATVLFGGIF